MLEFVHPVHETVRWTRYVSIATISYPLQPINLGFSYINYYFKYFFLSKIKNIEQRINRKKKRRRGIEQ